MIYRDIIDGLMVNENRKKKLWCKCGDDETRFAIRMHILYLYLQM